MKTLKAIAIQNYGSSGTTFMHSLLDGHPQTLQLPGLYGIGFYSYWRDMLRGRGTSIDRDYLMSRVLDFFRGLYDPQIVEPGWGLRELGQNRDENPCVPEGKFIELYKAFLSDLMRDFGISDEIRRSDLQLHRKAHIYAIYFAYDGALGRDISQKDFVIYPAHSCVKQDLMELMEDFQDVHFVHMVRNPVNNINSLFKYYLKIRTVDDPTNDMFSSGVHAMFLDRALTTGIPGRERERLHGIYFYDKSVRERSKAVLLEQLHSDSEKIMRAIAAFTGLPWNDVLLESTFGGKRWWNRPGLSRVSGFEKNIVSDSTNVFTERFDEQRIAVVAQPILEMYYPERQAVRGVVNTFKALAACLMPFKVEIANFYSVRARLIFSRHLGIFRAKMANAVYQDAISEFDIKRSKFDPKAHVLTAVDAVETPREGGNDTVTLIWKFDGANGEPAEARISGKFPAPVPGQNVYVVHHLEHIQKYWISRERAYPVNDTVKRIAHRYSFALDYAYHRYLLLKAFVFVRINKRNQVPLLLPKS